MLYMFLLYSDRELEPPADVGEQHGAVKDTTRASGKYICSEAFAGNHRAATVRIRKGEVMVTDGPFAETKEVLGGFYIIDCKDLDEALEYANRIPNAQFGAVEVRPVVGDAGQPWDYATASAGRERLRFAHHWTEEGG
jgi:hypothetical protein